MKDCLFCKIVKGEIPSQKVYEDDQTYAFLDINPVNKGHTLVIPKVHVENIFDAPSSLMKILTSTIQKIAIALGKSADGVNVFMSNKEAAGQEVFHLHYHLIPRFHDDGIQIKLPHKSFSDKEMAAIAEGIRKLLA